MEHSLSPQAVNYVDNMHKFLQEVKKNSKRQPQTILWFSKYIRSVKGFNFQLHRDDVEILLKDDDRFICINDTYTLKIYKDIVTNEQGVVEKSTTTTKAKKLKTVSDEKKTVAKSNNSLDAKSKKSKNGLDQFFDQQTTGRKVIEENSSMLYTYHISQPSIKATMFKHLESFFFSNDCSTTGDSHEKSTIIVGDVQAKVNSEYALLGTVQQTLKTSQSQTQSQSKSQYVYLNVHEPFVFTTVGIQGSGKSHSLCSVLENCLIPVPYLNISTLQQPMSALVLHYDHSSTTICEAIGIRRESKRFKALSENNTTNSSSSSSNNNTTTISTSMPLCTVVVLVSPSYYHQRKQFYEKENVIVKPLLFEWSKLTADNIKSLMGLNNSDSQMYVSTMLTLLRTYQRFDEMPTFSKFKKTVFGIVASTQSGPLEQRFGYLENFIKESEVNRIYEKIYSTIENECNPGTLVVVDLTDPLLLRIEVNSVFQILCERYRALPMSCGKVLALDEAHKFMDGQKESDGLSKAIIDIARLMRHDGMRLAVSTQSPLSLAPELLELVSVSVLHQMHSKDWFTYLQKKLPLDDEQYHTLMNLQPGHGLLFSSHMTFQPSPPPPAAAAPSPPPTTTTPPAAAPATALKLDSMKSVPTTVISKTHSSSTTNNHMMHVVEDYLLEPSNMKINSSNSSNNTSDISISKDSDITKIMQGGESITTKRLYSDININDNSTPSQVDVHVDSKSDIIHKKVIPIRIRARLTEDRGKSICNTINTM